MRDDFERVDRHERDALAQQVGDGRRPALVRHVQHVDVRRFLEQLAGEMARAAVAGGGIAELAWLGLRLGDQALERRHAGFCRHHQHQRGLPHARHRHEIPRRVERQLGEQRGIGGQAVGRHHDGVAVRRSLGHCLHADIGAGAGAIVDDDGLLEQHAHLLPDRARHDIHPAARGIRHDEPDGPGRVGLGAGGAGGAGGQRQRGGQTAGKVGSAQHACLLIVQSVMRFETDCVHSGQPP